MGSSQVELPMGSSQVELQDCIEDAPRVLFGRIPEYVECVGYCATGHGNDTGDDGSDQPDTGSASDDE